MKKIVFFLLIIVVSIFGMQQLKDVKEQLRMLRAAGVPESELADLKRQEAALESPAARPANNPEFEALLRRWKQIVPTTENQLIEKNGLAAELLINLAQQSGSRWFYTGDLLNRVLEIKETPVENQPPFGLTIAVPQEVRATLANDLVYLVSFQQFENTCGFHSLANAYAVTKQVNENKPVTYAETREIAQDIFRSRIETNADFRKLICPTSFTEPEYSDLLSVIRALGFRSHFDPNPNFFLIDSTNINDQSVLPVQARAITRNTVTNFMYRTRDHFFMISVVKYRNGTYKMFLLDSLNSLLRPGSLKARFVAHIDNLIQMAKGVAAPAAQPQRASQPIQETQSQVSAQVNEMKREQEEIDAAIARSLAQEESPVQPASRAATTSTSTSSSSSSTSQQEWQRLQEERRAAHSARREAERQAAERARQTPQQPQPQMQPQRPAAAPAVQSDQEAEIAAYEARRRAELERLLGEDLPD